MTLSHIKFYPAFQGQLCERTNARPYTHKHNTDFVFLNNSTPVNVWRKLDKLKVTEILKEEH